MMELEECGKLNKIYIMSNALYTFQQKTEINLQKCFVIKIEI